MISLLLFVLGLHCCVGALAVVSRGCSLLQCMGFSLWWLLLLQSTGSRVQAKDQTCVPCLGRWSLYHWTTREAHHELLILSFATC